MKADDQKAISLILFYTALLFFLIGMAARMKMNFHHRLEISTTGFVIAAVLASFGLITLMLSWVRKQR
jgi:hypothetical protein